MIKKSIYILLFVISGALAGCGGKTMDSIESSEETTTQIEAAILQGRGDARRIINQNFKDSMAFHAAILEANARKSEYQLKKHPKCEAAYDSAFISTIRTTRPDLARALSGH